MTLSFKNSESLYQRATQTIPLGSQTFSKSTMNLVQGASPYFLKSGKGCVVTDVDDNQFTDFVLGLLPNILGYCDPDVDAAITEQLKRGITFSLATELELALSEKLVELIPCAEMTRFAKNGSDVTSAAIRLARAHTGRDKVIAMGYHGWHDWYIGSTSRNKGVPSVVAELTSTVKFNDINALEQRLIQQGNDTAAIILEPTGYMEPAPDYLAKVKALSQQYGIVLIFDEIITGFRASMGGAQAVYGVTPDLACFGKSMANGLPLSALAGKKSIMTLTEEIFFSGTFAGETLSLAGSLATINKLQALQGPSLLAKFGLELKTHLLEELKQHNLLEYVDIAGPDWWPVLHFYGSDNDQVNLHKSLFFQAMLEAKILMFTTANLCMAHLQQKTEIFQQMALGIAKFANYVTHRDPMSQLNGDPIKSIFKVR